LASERRKWQRQPFSGAAFWQRFSAPISGNAFNGVGERRRRRARQILWQRNPRGQTFEAAQQAVIDRFTEVPVLHSVYAEADRGPRQPAPVAASRVSWDAAKTTRAVKAFVRNEPGSRPPEYPCVGSEAELVGCVALNSDWLYEGHSSDLPHLIVLGVAMDHERLRQLPGDGVQQFEGQLEVADQYNRGARVAAWLSQWLRSHGFRTRIHAGPWVGSLNMLPAALAAGFGELGKHGSIINRELGSSLRLAAVETDAPLEFDQPDRFGADEFCTGCEVCTNACPPQAISPRKEWVRGELKWFVDFDKCVPYFYETHSCGICLAVCPWSTPGRSKKLADVWTKRIIKQ
jgi:NAD-dependent dihydropyrimidine dehydrogenase PreA subunit